MPIDITIIKSPENVVTERVSKTFSEGGGTIGRGQDNSWVLDDPERFMSSKHSEIMFQNGQYFLVDLSTNGTFVNGSSEPIGNGNKITLNDGDRFSISDYEFLVSLRAHGTDDQLFNQYVDSGPFGDVDYSRNDHHEEYNSQLFSQNDPFAMPSSDMPAHAQTQDSLFGLGMEETDPIAVLDKANSNHNPSFARSVFDTATHAEQGDALNDAIAWPQSFPETGGIPEDWYEENTDVVETSHAAPAHDSEILNRFEDQYRALEQENQQLIKEVARLTQQIKKQKSQKAMPVSESVSTRTITQIDKTLIEAMGLEKWNLNKQKMLQISQVVGVLVRETMEGMMQVLKFRKKIKEEFRINVTTIQPVENNPLKFSANIDDAMENMFIKENNAYKEPIEAVQEGFQGIAEHQIAVLAGIQAAFRGMIERFDPEVLEKRFEKYNKTGLIQLGQKGKNWEAYKKFHEELVNNMDNSFQHLFGYDFVQAYEEQMQRLAISRKAEAKKKSRL